MHGEGGMREVNRCSISVATSVAEFDALREEWDLLLERSDATPFQSFDWQRTWWDHFGSPNPSFRLHLVTVREAGALVAIAPFFVESVTRWGIVSLRKLSFIGTEITDYLGVIIVRGREADCLAEIASHLAGQSSAVDVLHLVDMPGRFPFHRLLFESLKSSGFTGTSFVNEVSPRTTLHQTWEATIGSFPSSKRASVKRVLRKLQSDYPVELTVVTDAGYAPSDFDEFISLHQERWNGVGQQGVFADQRKTAFHRVIAERFFGRKWLFLAFLSIDGKRVAANYGVIFRGEYYFYLSGIAHRQELAKYSLGKVLHAFSMEDVIAKGVHTYDFMRGPERYKYDLNGIEDTNWTILMYSRRPRLARFKFSFVLLIDSLGRRIRQEQFLYRHYVEHHPGRMFASLPSFIGTRIRANMRDGVKKLRAPEKSIYERDQAS